MIMIIPTPKDNAWLQMLGQVQMRYPVSRVFSYDVNIGKVIP